MKREGVKDIVERGMQELHEALAAGKSDRLRHFLGVMSRFPRYSFNNCLLIATQFPTARLIQGFHGWRKLGRSVKKGEKAIGIIAPMIGKKGDADVQAAGHGERAIFGFKVVHVFDVSQTEGDDLPEIAQVSGDPGRHIAAVEGLIRSWGVELDYEEIASGADGLSMKGRIVIAPDLEPARKLITLIHEASHERLHADAERRKQTTKTVRETEAEAVAYIVGNGLGLDALAHCTDYIQLYDGDAETFAKSMDLIHRTAAEILAGVQSHAESDAVETALRVA